MREIISPLSGFGSPFGVRRAGGGAPPEPTITIAAPTWSDDFNAYADGTRLVAGDPNANAGLVATNPGNLGWEAITTGGATNARFNPVIFQGRVRQRTANGIFNGGNGTYLLAPAGLSQSGDQFAEVQIELGKNNFRFREFTLLGTDQNNRLDIQVQDRTPDAPNTINMRQIIAGTASTLVSYQAGGLEIRRMGGASNGLAKAYSGTETFRAVFVNNKVFIRRGLGFSLGTAAGTAFSALSGTRFGLNSEQDRADWVDAAAVGPCPTVLTINENYRVWVPKRRAAASDPVTSGTGDATFSGTYDGVAPTRLAWGLVNPNTGAEVKSLVLVPTADVTITPTSATTGTWTARLREIPCGLNGREAYSPRFVPVDASNVAHTRGGICGTTEFYVTFNIGLIGQSNAADLANVTLSGSIPLQPGGGAYFNNVPPSTTAGIIRRASDWYSGAATGGGALCAPACNLLSALWNIPVSFESLAIGARGAPVLGPIDGSTGLPHPSTDWAHIQQQHAFAGGRYEALVLSQGENEAASGGALWEVRWQANIAAYRDPSMTGQPEGTLIPVFYGITGHSTADPTAAATDASINARNLGQANLQNSVSDCILAYNHEGAARNTVSQAELVHFTRDAVNGYSDLARRIGLSMRRYYSGTGIWGRGPIATGVTRSGAVLTITYDLNGADSLQARSARDSATAGDANALTSWQVSADNFSTLLPISSAVLTGNTVVITLSADPGGPVRVRNLSGNLPSFASYPHGLYADGTRIGSMPVHVPLLSN